MRLASVHPFLLSYPFPTPRRLTYYGGAPAIPQPDALPTHVESDHRLVGYAPGEGSEKARGIIESRIAPFLEGRVLSDPDALRVHFTESLGREQEVERVYCAVEMALFDLVGKEKGLPVSELIGGRVRDRIRLYGSAGMYMAPEEYAAEAKAIAELGFRAYKMRAGIGPDKDLDTVRRMRDAAGPAFDLMVDAHTWWPLGDRNYVQSTIEKLAEQFALFNVAWLEEPLPPGDHAGYRRLKELDYIPIAICEHEPDASPYL